MNGFEGLIWFLLGFGTTLAGYLYGRQTALKDLEGVIEQLDRVIKRMGAGDSK